MKCHVDGSCSFCSSTAGGLAGTDTVPHSGCTALNPECNAGGTACQCDQVVCDKETSTVCSAKVCKCGGSNACSGMMPKCDTSSKPATCVSCATDAGAEGDATSQGTCPTDSLLCLSDGSCSCQKDNAGGGAGDAMSAGTCTAAGQLC